MQQFEGDWPTLAERPAPPANSLWTARAYDDRLAAPRPCRHCGRAVRQALFTGGIERQLYVEGPLLAAGVGQPHWPAFWWSHRNGLHDRYPEMDGKHEAAGDLLFVMHPCELPQYRPTSQPPAPQVIPTQPAPPTPRGAPLPMTNPNDDPFAGGDKLPAVSFKNAPVGTTVTLLVTAAPKKVQARDYDTNEPAVWKDGNPKMTVVTEGTVAGEARSLWAAQPSSMFSAIAEAQRAAGATVQPGGFLSIQFYDTEENKDPKKEARKLYRAHYVPPVVDAFGGAPAAAPAAPPAAPTPPVPAAAPFPPAAAPAAAPFPPAAPAPAAQPAAAAPAAPWAGPATASPAAARWS